MLTTVGVLTVVGALFANIIVVRAAGWNRMSAARLTWAKWVGATSYAAALNFLIWGLVFAQMPGIPTAVLVLIAVGTVGVLALALRANLSLFDTIRDRQW